MLVNPPKSSQGVQGLFGQGNQSVLVALGVTDMNPHVGWVDITDSEPDTFSETQPHAVGGKEKHPVAQLVGCTEQSVQLLNRLDVRDSGSLRWFDEGNLLPCLAQYSGVKEL